MHHPRRASAFRSILERETILERFPVPARGALPVAAGYPAPYRIGTANLGFHFLYGNLRRTPALEVERFFSDTSPITLETGRKLSGMAALFFTVSYEEDYLNVVRMLHESGVPPLREKRARGPLVVAGGPAVSANPAPLGEIADALALGEGEGTLDAIVRVLVGEDWDDRSAILRELSRIPAVLVPGVSVSGAGFREPVRDEPFPHSAFLTPRNAFPNTLLIETGRGCPGACSFCLATSIYRPFRFMGRDRVEEIVSYLAAPVRKIGLVSTAVAANPDFIPIVRMLVSRGIEVSMSSLRAEDLDEEKVRLLGSIGTKSVSLAPESGSERIRYRIGKKVPDELYFNIAARLSEAGVNHFTLYLLVGCPGEDAETVDATRSFMADFKKAIGGRGFSVHLNALVPKPWTPLQFYPMPGERSLAAFQGAMERMLRELGLRPRPKSIRSSLRQALLSLGDERLGRAIVHHVVDGHSWRKALGAAGVDEGFPHAKKGPETSFPWDAISGPVHRGVLFKRFEALADGTGDGAG